jgi:2-amino-4-hydroxy-6-hydroxymethyldihydropteridine diphosphokinase
MSKVYLLLGGNLGDRFQNISDAIIAINKRIGKVILQSAIYETKAWGLSEQPDFLNLAIVVETDLPPLSILDISQEIESELGRTRQINQKWGSRTMDIDLLFYDQEIIQTERLIIPHPLISLRKFVLRPLEEIVPNFVHPLLNQTIFDLNAQCKDNLVVKVWI